MIITIIRKPLVGSSVQNITLHNTGGINIDQTRISTSDVLSIGSNNRLNGNINFGMKDNRDTQSQSPEGRFPSNVLISHSGAIAIDEQSGVSVSTGGRIGNANGVYANQGKGGWKKEFEKGESGYGDTGGASRFFKVIK